jgi:CHAT domain-containing protein
MLVELLVERGDTDLAFHYAERSRARSLLEQARTAGVEPPAPGSRAEAIQREIRALQARLDLAAAARSLPIETTVAHLGEAADDELQHRVDEYIRLLTSGPELQDRLERLRLELEATQPAPGTFDGVAPASLGAVTELLARAAEPTAVVYYLAVEPGLLRWLIEPSGRVHTDLLRFADLPLAETVTEIIRPLHVSLAATREHAARRDELLDRLSTVLLGPDTATALAGARTIVVVADGPLCYLPIDLLRSPLDPDRLVVDTWPTVYLPSLTTLSLLDRRRDPETGWAAQFIGFGDPVLEPPTAGAAGFAGWLAEQRVRLSPLPGSRIEVQAIAESFGTEGRAVVGAEFTEAAVRSLTGRTRYVHLATHAFVDPYDPLRSGLVLSPPATSDPDTDQFLQVHEIPALAIDAELVVCSACQTAVGEYRRGEGIVGIGQALLASGARNAVLSMWPVPDNITTTFMLAMYRELREGATVARALRGARQRVRRRHPDPYFWAPFIAIGSVPVMGRQPRG